MSSVRQSRPPSGVRLAKSDFEKLPLEATEAGDQGQLPSSAPALQQGDNNDQPLRLSLDALGLPDSNSATDLQTIQRRGSLDFSNDPPSAALLPPLHPRAVSPNGSFIGSSFAVSSSSAPPLVAAPPSPDPLVSTASPGLSRKSRTHSRSSSARSSKGSALTLPAPGKYTRASRSSSTDKDNSSRDSIKKESPTGSSFAKRFPEFAGEALIHETSCALVKRGLHLQGWLYVTPLRMVFFPLLGSSKVVIPFDQIKSLRKTRSMKVISAFSVRTSAKKYMFTSMWNRDATYKMISKSLSGRDEDSSSNQSDHSSDEGEMAPDQQLSPQVARNLCGHFPPDFPRLDRGNMFFAFRISFPIKLKRFWNAALADGAPRDWIASLGTPNNPYLMPEATPWLATTEQSCCLTRTLRYTCGKVEVKEIQMASMSSSLLIFSRLTVSTPDASGPEHLEAYWEITKGPARSSLLQVFMFSQAYTRPKISTPFFSDYFDHWSSSLTLSMANRSHISSAGHSSSSHSHSHSSSSSSSSSASSASHSLAAAASLTAGPAAPKPNNLLVMGIFIIVLLLFLLTQWLSSTISGLQQEVDSFSSPVSQLSTHTIEALKNFLPSR